MNFSTFGSLSEFRSDDSGIWQIYKTFANNTLDLITQLFNKQKKLPPDKLKLENETRRDSVHKINKSSLICLIREYLLNSYH